MSIQQMIDTGEVDTTLPTDLLEDASSSIDQLLDILRTGSQEPSVVDAITRLQNVSGLILKTLNSRRGSDGMTPL